MKKIFRLAILAATLFTMSSCVDFPGTEGPMGPQGPQGEPGKDGLGVSKTIMVKVPQTAWAYSDLDNNNYFIATADVPEITKNVLRYGLVKFYRVFNYDTKDETYIELPYILQCEYPIDAANGQWGFYTEAVSAEFGQGIAKFIYTASDFDYELNESFVPEEMLFRLVIMQ